MAVSAKFRVGRITTWAKDEEGFPTQGEVELVPDDGLRHAYLGF